LNEILTEFDRVIAELRRTAPGLFGIHAAFDKVLADLREHHAPTAPPVFTRSDQWTAPPTEESTAFIPVLVGAAVTVTEPTEPETDDETDDDDTSEREN